MATVKSLEIRLEMLEAKIEAVRKGSQSSLDKVRIGVDKALSSIQDDVYTVERWQRKVNQFREDLWGVAKTSLAVTAIVSLVIHIYHWVLG